MAKHSATPQSKDTSRQPERRTVGSAVLRLLLAPWRLFKWVFFTDLRLQRQGGKLKVVLDSAPAAMGGQAGSEPKVTQPEDEMRRELQGLLDQHPQTRKVMKHLVMFEEALCRLGATKAMQDVPLELLTPALEQLEGLLDEKPSQALALLRNKMMLIAIEREKKEVAINASARPSDFNVDDKLEVEEVPGSVFSTQVFRDLNATLEQIKDKK